LYSPSGDGGSAMILLKAHGGEIKVETKENEGTAFIIQIPFKKIS